MIIVIIVTIVVAGWLIEQGHIQGFTVNGSSGTYNVSDNGSGGVINVRAGNVLRIDLQISGSPIPTVVWLKDQKPISLSNRVCAKLNTIIKN